MDASNKPSSMLLHAHPSHPTLAGSEESREGLPWTKPLILSRKAGEENNLAGRNKLENRMETWPEGVSSAQKWFPTLAQAPLPGPFLGMGLQWPMEQPPDIWSFPAEGGSGHLKISATYCALTVATNYAQCLIVSPDTWVVLIMK